MQMYRYSQAGLLHNFAEELHHSHIEVDRKPHTGQTRTNKKKEANLLTVWKNLKYIVPIASR